MRLHIDGRLVAWNSGRVDAQSYYGYRRIGTGSMGSRSSPNAIGHRGGGVRFAVDADT